MKQENINSWGISFIHSDGSFYVHPRFIVSCNFRDNNDEIELEVINNHYHHFYFNSRQQYEEAKEVMLRELELFSTRVVTANTNTYETNSSDYWLGGI